MGYEQEGYTDEVEINWDDEGAVVGEGAYNVQVKDAVYKKTSTEKHMVSVHFTIIDAMDPDNVKFVGKTLFENLLFAPGSMFRTVNFVESIGAPKPSPINKAVLDGWASEIKGLQCSVTTKHRIYNDQKQTNISRFYQLGSLAGEGEVEAVEGAETQEEQVQEPEPEAPKRSLRDAAVNGHVNGKSNGATKPATPAKAPAKAPAQRFDPKAKAKR